NSARPARRPGQVAAAAGGFDRADAKAGHRLGGERAAGDPRLPALFRLDREVFRRGPDHPPFAVIAQRLLGDLDGPAEVEDFFDLRIGQIKNTFSSHDHTLMPWRRLSKPSGIENTRNRELLPPRRKDAKVTGQGQNSCK